MEGLGYDDVWVDDVGNVIGVYRGSGGGRTVQFNAHLDHVDAGDPALWPRPPFAGAIEGDVLYGRGASDVKGALAPQVYLVPVLRAAGLRPAGDVYVVGVVLEEVGGFGTAFLCETLPTDAAVLAEATGNQLRRGHRGRVPLEVTFVGRSVHASVPEAGANPHFALARFLTRLESLPMTPSATFGRSTVAPTLIRTDQTSANVTPGAITLTLDWRSVPGEEASEVAAWVRALAEESAGEGIAARVEVVERSVRSYTGREAEMPPTRGFEVPLDHPVLRAAAVALEAALARPVEIGVWGFATDGGHLMHHGIPTIGFSPCEERYAHTVHDQVSLPLMREALVGNAALALALTGIER
ncbi:MAG: M20/M25/M40 family metallo-hydrolase [Thermomicrobiaceae bacterium]|nr:M20/M25/M40 family metallo-hydrolase [Thermomicrobiaceae bacterium]